MAIPIGANLERLAKGVGNLFKPATYKAASQAARAEAENVGPIRSVWNSFKETRVGEFTTGAATEAKHGIGWLITAPFKAAWGAGAWLVKSTLSLLVLRPANAIVGGLANFTERSPYASAAIIGGGGLMAGGSWLAHRRSTAMMTQYAQAHEAAIQAAVAQEAMSAQPPVSYKNSVSPDLSAELAARQTAGKNGEVTSHAATVTAAREAAAAQPATSAPVTSVA